MAWSVLTLNPDASGLWIFQSQFLSGEGRALKRHSSYTNTLAIS